MSKKPGLLVIISSPSGGGKDTVINALVKLLPSATRLITTTSRPPRPGNIEGVDYYFVTAEEFKRRLAAGAFLEYNIYADNYYGEEKTVLHECLSQFDIVFTQIDVTGKHALDKLKFPHLAIFLAPENLDVLRKRIEKRGGIDPTTIEKRLEIAKKEIEQSVDYEHRIVNIEGKLDETIAKVAKIVINSLKTRDNQGAGLTKNE
ncbi:MAG: guanylate kinase [Candidatus Magasanikbacteria bacterium]|nr:guanylate kinase [Candidatus Magasanikbacteria bacterium]